MKVKDASKLNSNKDEVSSLLKNSSPAKSDSQLRDNTTSDFKSNKETTEDDRGYEIINAKEFHKANEFNQFETLKDQKHVFSQNNPQSNIKTKSQSKNKIQEFVVIPKPPAIQNVRQSNTASSRIPGITKPNSVARTSNIPQQEEIKKHKGKTPSFGNTNAPLFLNNFNIETSDINSGANTPSYTKVEENKFDRKTFSKMPNTNLIDKFAAPVLSHRDVKKTTSKNTARAVQRDRPMSKKASPKLTKEISFPSSNQKPILTDKRNQLISEKKEPEVKISRRQQSVGIKPNSSTPISKTSGKTPRLDYKERIPFEYQKSSTPNNKYEDKRTPSRQRNTNPRLNFLSPTVSSKHKQSNQKPKNNPKPQLYTIEDLDQNRIEELKENEISKKLDMDKIDDEGGLTTGYQNYEEEKEDEINMFVGSHIEDKFQFSSGEKEKEYQSIKQPNFNEGNAIGLLI